jgi:hypothetical protein
VVANSFAGNRLSRAEPHQSLVKGPAESLPRGTERASLLKITAASFANRVAICGRLAAGVILATEKGAVCAYLAWRICAPTGGHRSATRDLMPTMKVPADRLLEPDSLRSTAIPRSDRLSGGRTEPNIIVLARPVADRQHGLESRRWLARLAAGRSASRRSAPGPPRAPFGGGLASFRGPGSCGGTGETSIAVPAPRRRRPSTEPLAPLATARRFRGAAPLPASRRGSLLLVVQIGGIGLPRSRQRAVFRSRGRSVELSGCIARVSAILSPRACARHRLGLSCCRHSSASHSTGRAGADRLGKASGPPSNGRYQNGCRRRSRRPFRPLRLEAEAGWHVRGCLEAAAAAVSPPPCLSESRRN